LFENNGVIPLSDEPPQAHHQDLLDLQYASSITCQEKRTVLVYPTFLRERRCGEMQGCDDSHKPRSYLSKEETCSSTIATESLFRSCTIKMKDGKDMSADHMNDRAHVRVAGKMGKLIMRVDEGVKQAMPIQKDTVWHTPDHTTGSILLPIAHFQNSTLSITMWHVGDLKMSQMSCDIIIEICLLHL